VCVTAWALVRLAAHTAIKIYIYSVSPHAWWQTHKPVWPDRGATATQAASGIVNGNVPTIHVITTHGPPLLFPLPLIWTDLKVVCILLCSISTSVIHRATSQAAGDSVSLSICQLVRKPMLQSISHTVSRSVPLSCSNSAFRSVSQRASHSAGPSTSQCVSLWSHRVYIN